MSIPTKINQILLRSKPGNEEAVYKLGQPDSTFELVQVDVPQLGDGQLLLQALYFSNDPAQRGWINKFQDPKRTYRPPPKVGEPMACARLAKAWHVGCDFYPTVALAVWKVVKSTSPKFAPGAKVLTGAPGWVDYAVVDDSTVLALPELGVPTSTFVGSLGGPGLTAYFGLKEVLKFQEGQSIIITGAAGAVGNVGLAVKAGFSPDAPLQVAVQLAKHVYHASKVVAIAGTDEKVAWLKNIGADVAINYKSPTFVEDLTREGYNVDAAFDQVAGEQLDLILSLVKKGGSIAACGGISAYNSGFGITLKHYMDIVQQRLRLQGFIVTDYASQFEEARKELAEAVKTGKLTIKGAETIVRGSIEDVPQIWSKLFVGANTGKLVTQLADE